MSDTGSGETVVSSLFKVMICFLSVVEFKSKLMCLIG